MPKKWEISTGEFIKTKSGLLELVRDVDNIDDLTFHDLGIEHNPLPLSEVEESFVDILSITSARSILADANIFSSSENEFIEELYDCNTYGHLRISRILLEKSTMAGCKRITEDERVSVISQNKAEFHKYCDILRDHLQWMEGKYQSAIKRRGRRILSKVSDAKKREFQELVEIAADIDWGVKLFFPQRREIYDAIAELTINVVRETDALEKSSPQLGIFYSSGKYVTDFKIPHADEHLAAAALYISLMQGSDVAILSFDFDIKKILNNVAQVLTTQDTKDGHHVYNGLGRNPISQFFRAQRDENQEWKLVFTTANLPQYVAKFRVKSHVTKESWQHMVQAAENVQDMLFKQTYH